MWSYYDSVYFCCRSLVNKICGCIIVGLVVVVVRQELHMLGLLLFSFISKHNICSYYDWVCRFCRQSVNTTCGRNKVGFVFVVVRQ